MWGDGEGPAVVGLPWGALRSELHDDLCAGGPRTGRACTGLAVCGELAVPAVHTDPHTLPFKSFHGSHSRYKARVCLCHRGHFPTS